MNHPSLSGVDIRYLHALRAVVRNSTFHAAAHELGYTQSAISQQVASLERIVGHQLLLRPGGRRAAEPTQAGWIVLAAADSILARLAVAEADLRALTDGTTGTVRVGAFESAASQVLPALLDRLERDRPGLQVEVHVRDATVEIERAVAFGEVDFAVSSLPVDDPLLSHQELFADPAVVLVADGDPLAAGGQLTADDLKDRRLAGFFACRHEEQIEGRLDELGIRPGITVRADNTAALLELVRGGTVAGVVPALAARNAGPGIVVLDASEILPSRRCAICWASERPLSPAAHAVRDLLAEVASQVGSILRRGRRASMHAVPDRPVRRAGAGLRS